MFQEGKIKTYHEARGFGFIQIEGESKDLFFHIKETASQSISQFKCDGREHCSQMSSYEEALFFIRNCPNTKMDGDSDGIPCESQF